MKYDTPKNYFADLAVAIIFVIAMVLLFGCNVAKQDQRAVDRVTASRPLLDKVGAKWAELNPCANDTILEFIHDSTTVTDYKRDTLIEERNDTIYYFITDTLNKTRTVTRNIIVTDNRAVDSLKAQSVVSKLEIARLNGNIQAKENEIKLAHKSSNKWMWCFFSLAAVIAAVVVLILLKPKISL